MEIKEKTVKTPKNYLDNVEMLEHIKVYKQKCKEAEATGKPKPQMPNYIGRKLDLIANGLAKLPNFSGYSFIDEMKADAVENCIVYFDNFDPNKIHPKTGKPYDNPHAYFTMIMIHAFIRRIQKEKKQSVLKHKILHRMYAVEELGEYINVVNNSLDNPYMDDLVDSYDNSIEKRKRGRPKKSKKNENKK